MKKIIVSIIVIGLLLSTAPLTMGGEKAVNEEQSDTGVSFDVEEGTLNDFASDIGELIQHNSNDTSINLPKYVSGELIVKFNDDVKVCMPGSTNGASSTGATAKGSDGGMLAIGIESIDQLNTEYGVISIEELFPDTTIPSLSNIYKFTFTVDADIPQIMSEYNSDSNVVYAEPNYLFTTSYAQPPIPKLIPDDSYMFEQWGIHNTAQYRMYLAFESVNYKYDADIDAPEAWSLATGNEDVVIAIIDSGVDYNHPDLADNIWHDPINGNPGYDFVDIDLSFYEEYGFTPCPDEDYTIPDGNPMDVMGHGTHCAGIAGAVTNNSDGIAGVSWNCKVMPVRNGFKIMYGGSTYGMMEYDDSAAAIIYATDNGADVISMSWGGYFKSQLIHDVLDYAYSNDVVLVSAAGNDNSIVKSYPACYDNVISVAATSPDDTKALFSNYGETVDVAAPGEFILSTIPTENTGSYASFSDLFVETEKINSRPLYDTPLGNANGEIVYVGNASEEELEGVDLTDKIALIEKHEKYWMLHSQVNNVYDKGAIGTIFFNNEPGSFWTWIHDGSEIPAVSIPSEDAQDIIQMLEQGVVTSDLTVFKDAYQYYKGTSMACPLVAGIAGLLISKNQQCPYPAQMAKSMIPFTSDKINTGYNLGGGRINAYKALKQKPFAAVLDPIDNWQDVKGTIDIKGAAWGEDFQNFVLEDGLGEEPETWTPLLTSAIPKGGVLLSLDTTQLDEGLHTIRLKVVCDHGVYTDETLIYVNNEADNGISADVYVSNCFDSSTPDWGVTKFSSIQDGIDQAKSGDTVFVFDGLYNENVKCLLKTIDLIGQNKDWAIIDGFVNISLSSKVTVKGFTVRRPLILFTSNKCTIFENNFEVTNDLEWAIELNLSPNNNIKSNIFKGLGFPLGTGGILILRSSDNTISDNSFSNLLKSISSYWLLSRRNTISSNTINGYYMKLPRTWSSQYIIGSYGIDLQTSSNHVVKNNIINKHLFGIFVKFSNLNEITKNYITTTDVGIMILTQSSFNKIVANEITSDGMSIWLSFFLDGFYNCSYNKIYYNNLNSGYALDHFKKNSTNIWYKEKLFGKDMGNYHHNYEEYMMEHVGEEPKDENNDGIWDVPFSLCPWNNIEECNKDLYPVVSPFDIENVEVSYEMSEEMTVEESEYLAQIEETINSQILSGEININDFMNS